MTRVKELSVFFPAVNEEGNITSTVLDAKAVLEKVADRWEIIIIDDGSKDKTGEIADKLAGEDKRIRVIHHSPNRGYGGALKSGYEAARYEWIAFTDSDGQFKFSDIDKFIAKFDEGDLILGYRINRKDPFVRSLYTLVWSKLLPLLLFGVRVKDYSCGFWVIKKKVYAAIAPIKSEEKVTKIEMLVKAKRKGFKFVEVGVKHYPRRSGRATGADIKVITRSLIGLFELWIRSKS